MLHIAGGIILGVLILAFMPIIAYLLLLVAWISGPLLLAKLVAENDGQVLAILLVCWGLPMAVYLWHDWGERRGARDYQLRMIEKKLETDLSFEVAEINRPPEPAFEWEKELSEFQKCYLGRKDNKRPAQAACRADGLPYLG